LKFRNILLHFIWLQLVIHQKIAVYPYIEEQTTQWPKEKGQKDKQWSTKHTHKTKIK
jgi:Ca2+/H+ antiporter